MNNPIKKAIETMSDRRLKNEAERLERVQAEVARRKEQRENAKERAEADAEAKRNAAKIREWTASAKSTKAEIEKATDDLDAAVRGLRAFQVRNAALVRHRALLCELGRVGVKVSEPSFKGLSEEAIRTAERVFVGLGIELGLTVTERPLLTYR